MTRDTTTPGTPPMGTDIAAFRGSVMRAYVDALATERVLASVRERVSDEVRERMDMLPTSSQWVPAHLTNCLLDAYLELRDLDAVRALSRTANRNGIVRIIEPLIRTAMRLGGATPAAVLSRLDLILSRQQRGYTFRWSELDARAGRLVYSAHGLSDTAASLASWEGALSNAFDLTGTQGTVRVENVSRRREGTVTTLLARW